MAKTARKKVDGYCGSCRIDRSHQVLESVKGRPLLVKCTSCGAEAAHMSPRAGLKAALLEAAERKQADRERSRLLDELARLRSKGKLTREVWHELIGDRDAEEATRYQMSAALEELELVQHPAFGLGIVIGRADDRKAHVLFEDRERLMVCAPAVEDSA